MPHLIKIFTVVLENKLHLWYDTPPSFLLAVLKPIKYFFSNIFQQNSFTNLKALLYLITVTGTCLIFMAPELWHYHGCMWRVCQTVGKERRRRSWHSFEVDQVDVLKRRIRRLKHSVNTRHESIFSDPDVVRELSRLHENFVIAPADKASNNDTFICKRHYISILSEELGLNSLPGNPTYNLTDFSASEVLDNHKSVLTSFGIETSDDELDLPYIFWIPKMHKNPYKHRFIAGSSKCSTKPLSVFLTKLLTHIKQGLQKYCETAYSRNGIIQMWILKNY